MTTQTVDERRTELRDEAQARIARAFEGWGQAWWTDDSGDHLARVAADAILDMLADDDAERLTDMAEVANMARRAERARIVEWIEENYSPGRIADRIAMGEHE